MGGGILTFEGDRALCKARIFGFSHAEQGGREEGVIDEILHVVALALIFGFGAHLVRDVLPAAEDHKTPLTPLRRVSGAPFKRVPPVTALDKALTSFRSRSP